MLRQTLGKLIWRLCVKWDAGGEKRWKSRHEAITIVSGNSNKTCLREKLINNKLLTPNGTSLAEDRVARNEKCLEPLTVRENWK